MATSASNKSMANIPEYVRKQIGGTATAAAGTYADVVKSASSPSSGGLNISRSGAITAPGADKASPLTGISTPGVGSGALKTYTGAAQSGAQPALTYTQTAQADPTAANPRHEWSGTAQSGAQPAQTYAQAEQSAGGLPAGVKETTYIDASGNKRTGYIINNLTYTDPAGQNRVGVGSIVNTADGAYILTDQGGKRYSDYLAEQQATKPLTPEGTVDYDALISMYNAELETALANNDSAYAAQLQRQIADAEAQKEALNRQYAATNQQLYRDSMMQQKNLPQQLAALGYTGGLTESSMLDLATSYSEALRQNESDRAQGILSIDRGMSDEQLQAEIARLQAAQELRGDYTSSYAGALASAQAQSNWEREYAAQQKAATDETASATGWSFLEAGVMPSADMLAAMGIDSAQASAYISALGLDGSTATAGGGSYVPTGNPDLSLEPTAPVSALSAARTSGLLSGIPYQGATTPVTDLTPGKTAQGLFQKAQASKNDATATDAVINELMTAVEAGSVSETEARYILKNVYGME